MLTVLALLASASGEEGYSVVGDAVVVDRPEHWRAWRYPYGTLDEQALDEGIVRPVYVRQPEDPLDPKQKVDAVRDIGKFKFLQSEEYLDLWPRWPVRAGTNEESAMNVIDGDPDTYWEPEPKDLFPPSYPKRFTKWWIDVDLGRLVNAVKVVLRFAEDGDPFRQFSVYISDENMTPATYGKPLKDREFSYTYIGGTKRPVEGPDAPKVFEFYLRPTVRPGEGFAYTMSGQRADPWWRGDLVRYVRIAVTDWRASTWSPYRGPKPGDWAWVLIDLGATFWVDRYQFITFFPSGGSWWYSLLRGYVVEGSDGSRAPDGSPIWRQISPDWRKYSEHNPNKDTPLRGRLPPSEAQVPDYTELRHNREGSWDGRGGDVGGADVVRKGLCVRGRA